MAIFVTGDTHGDARREMQRFNSNNFSIQKELTKEDYVIIAGDFGFCWSPKETKEENYWLNWLNERNFTTLFIDGNHENYYRLYTYPIAEWNGGKVQFLRPNVIHLMRGQVYELNGKVITTMGGAPSHDIQDGIFDPDDYDSIDEMKKDIQNLYKKKGGAAFAMYRIKGLSWWPQEVPNEREWNEWKYNLARYNNKVDYVITHECPASTTPFVSIYNSTDMSKELEKIRQNIEYRHWFFGHYHLDKSINERETAVYNDIRRIQ